MKTTDEIKSNIIKDSIRISSRRSLASEIVSALRELILLEKLKPGLAFSERDLAAGLGVSRTPLKEAIRILENEGLIEYGATRRPRVANPSIEEIKHNFQVLGSLEALAGENCCSFATDEEIEELSRMQIQMKLNEKKSDNIEYFQMDMLFHSTIVKYSRNKPLFVTHEQYNSRLWRARYISSKLRGERNRNLGQHIDIVEAIKRRDPRDTATQLRRHLETAITNVTIALSNKE
ncbi:GntR family transcriptional regulator [Roseibium sp. RKSG952]|uniref:GntR family transcriptional regulator n=1 Tax=Roseibium sp. RKSG952 TaxID=2529384 RepID=UPI0012BC21F5|nr:GntR family transcriptional regulator [Roseibium sp. RKSG952]MTH95435.1 GntR family transcriptional regulator [Roseibium sp. RKSG952]